MSNVPNTITIDGVNFVRADSVTAPVPKGPIKIVIADKGFVFVGHCEFFDNGSVEITKAKNIRRFGTTKGLGQLQYGPTSSTVLDDCGTVTLPAHSVVATLEVEQNKWAL